MGIDRKEMKKRAAATYAALACVCQALNQLLENQLRGYGLTMSQFRVLRELLLKGTQTLADLAAEMSRYESDVYVVLRNLGKNGLVTRRAHESDRRKFSIYLTPAGGELIRQIVPLQANIIHARMSMLGSREQETLRRLCEKLEDVDMLKFVLEFTRDDDEESED